MAESHDAFLELLDHEKVATGAALTDWMATDTDDIDTYLDEQNELIDNANQYDIGPAPPPRVTRPGPAPFLRPNSPRGYPFRRSHPGRTRQPTRLS